MQCIELETYLGMVECAQTFIISGRFILYYIPTLLCNQNATCFSKRFRVLIIAVGNWISDLSNALTVGENVFFRMVLHPT